jgi:DNA invertase Pin-like site-specific DNA recombinase
LGAKLGRFLEAIREGKVEAGSVLLVESLDRLSRDKVNKALEIFLAIINAGISVVTLADNRVYDAQKCDPMDIMMSLMIFVRANDESQMKSIRGNANWKTKRANAADKILTTRAPSWLKVENGKFVKIPAQVKIVETMFNESAAGVGAFTIAKRLGLHESYIQKVLSWRAVLGEYQGHKMVGTNKRVKDGDPIPNYYPRIISDELFDRVVNARHSRKRKGGGRKGQNLSNLFSGIAVCGHCRTKLRFVNKTHHYLVCPKCRFSCRYDSFESSFLQYVEEQLDISTMINGDSKRKTLGNEIEALKGKIIDDERAREKAFALVDTDPDFVAKKLKEFKESIATNTVALQEKEKELAKSKATKLDAEDLKKLAANKGEKSYIIRSQIAAKIKNLFAQVLLDRRDDIPNVPNMAPAFSIVKS